MNKAIEWTVETLKDRVQQKKIIAVLLAVAAYLTQQENAQSLFGIYGPKAAAVASAFTFIYSYIISPATIPEPPPKIARQDPPPATPTTSIENQQIS